MVHKQTYYGIDPWHPSDGIHPEDIPYISIGPFYGDPVQDRYGRVGIYRPVEDVCEPHNGNYPPRARGAVVFKDGTYTTVDDSLVSFRCAEEGIGFFEDGYTEECPVCGATVNDDDETGGSDDGDDDSVNDVPPMDEKEGKQSTISSFGKGGEQ